MLIELVICLDEQLRASAEVEMGRSVATEVEFRGKIEELVHENLVPHRGYYIYMPMGLGRKLAYLHCYIDIVST